MNFYKAVYQRRSASDRLFNEIHQKAVAGIKEHSESWTKHFEEN